MPETVPTLTLPTTRSTPTKRWIDQRILIIGQGGLGKSTLFSHGDKTYYEDTEGGIDHLAVIKLRCETWDDFRAHYAMLYAAHKAGTYPYDSVVVDTLDKFVACAEEDTVKWAKSKFTTIADKIKTISDCPEGTGWNRCKEAVMTSLKMLDQLPSALVLIAHPKSTTIEDPTGKYTKETIGVWGQLGTGILGWMHHNLHIQASYSQGGKLQRVVRAMPSKEIEAKSHGSIVKDRWLWETPDLAAEYAYLRSLFD